MSESKSESNPSAQSSKNQPKRVFTEEFKREAVRLATERGNLSAEAVARDLGLHESVLNRWKREVQKEAEQTVSSASENRPFASFPGQGNPRDEETVRLQRENRRLKEEVEILKKAVGIFTKGAR